MTLPLSYSRLFKTRNPKIEIRKSRAPSGKFLVCEFRISIFEFRTWWTGEDSNLRRPQGPADLQSAAFDHSATCPVRLSSSGQALRGPNRRRVAPRASAQNSILLCRGLRNSQRVVRDTNRAQCPRWFECRINSKSSESWPARSPIHRRIAARPATRRARSSWSWRRDSNPRPSDYKSDALPAELRQRSQTYNATRAAPKLQGLSYFFSPSHHPIRCSPKSRLFQPSRGGRGSFREGTFALVFSFRSVES